MDNLHNEKRINQKIRRRKGNEGARTKEKRMMELFLIVGFGMFFLLIYGIILLGLENKLLNEISKELGEIRTFSERNNGNR